MTDVDAVSSGVEKEVEENEGGQDRGKASSKNWKEPEWKKYENMSVEEKRKNYKCGDDYVQIKDIETWPEFYQNNGYLFSKIQKRTEIEKTGYSVDAIINDKISLWEGDITRLEIDAIVNAANWRLLGGGGVDGCIHRAAGETLVEECSLLHGCDPGNAKITSGHKLPAKHVIHTVGPIGKDEKALTNCYEKCLWLALKNEVRTLAFCCVSTGIYGYPNRDAAEVALKTTREWLGDERNAERVDRIIFCLFLEKDIDIYRTFMLKYFPPVELKKPTQKSEDKTAKTPAKPEKDEAKRKKAAEKKDTRTKHKDDTKKKDDENIKSGETLDIKKEGEEMKTEKKEEKDEAKVTGTLVEAKENKSFERSEGKIDEDKEMKEVGEMQKGRKGIVGSTGEDESSSKGGAGRNKEEENITEETNRDEEIQMQMGRKGIVGSGKDESSSKAGGRNEEEGNITEETQKDKETQMGRKVKDNESAEIPISKKQKQEVMNDSTKKRGLQDVEMPEEQPPAQQEQKTEGQDENMDVGDVPQQETNQSDVEMKAKDETTGTSQQDVIKENPESPLKT